MKPSRMNRTAKTMFNNKPNQTEPNRGVMLKTVFEGRSTVLRVSHLLEASSDSRDVGDVGPTKVKAEMFQVLQFLEDANRRNRQ